MVLAKAKNKLQLLGETILSHFPLTFETHLPDRLERAQLLENSLKGQRVDRSIDFDLLACLCENFSGSDIENIS